MSDCVMTYNIVKPAPGARRKFRARRVGCPGIASPPKVHTMVVPGIAGKVPPYCDRRSLSRL